MISTLKTWLGSSLEILGTYRTALRNRLTILAFHRISDGEDPIGIDYRSEAFDKFCAFLRRNTNVVSLREQVEGLHNGNVPGGTISITFDDGYIDNFTTAAPILERYGLTATFFVVSDFIGTSFVPWWDRCMQNPPGWMNWDQLAALQQRGFDIGCHTKTHADLAQLTDEQVSYELLESRAEIKRRLGIDVDLFAYPYGGADNIDARCREIVRKLGFSCCLSSHGGTNPLDADPYSLYRVPINFWYRTPQQFGCDLILNRVKPQLETNAHDGVRY